MVLETDSHINVLDATSTDRNVRVTWETVRQMYRLITLGSNPVRYEFRSGSRELYLIILRL